ncbi:MAG: class I tRNA ligase family protein, partial [Bacteroidota bacterium]
NDLLFDEKLCEQGRNFANKIWNAFRLLSGLEVADAPAPDVNRIAGAWFASRLSEAIVEIEEHFRKFRISDALLTTYKLVWDDFCSWYLEMIKPEYGKPIDRETHEQAISHFEVLLKLLHPFMPFITEELWHEVRAREEDDCVIRAAWPKAGEVNTLLIQQAGTAFTIISEIRNVRNSAGLSPKDPLALVLKEGPGAADESFRPVIIKLANLSAITVAAEKPANATTFLAGTMECHVPLAGVVDPVKEQESLRKEIEYLKGFLASVDKKLANERFVAGAPPQVVELERRKQADALAKLKSLEERLS